VRESLVLAASAGESCSSCRTTATCWWARPTRIYRRSRERQTELATFEYLIAVLAESLPGIKLTSADVATSFAGLRALIREDKEAPSSVPREEVILESASGLITVAGGKFTTHRAIAQKLVDRVMKSWGVELGVCPTLTTPFPGARPLADGDNSGGGATISMRSIRPHRRKS